MRESGSWAAAAADRSGAAPATAKPRIRGLRTGLGGATTVVKLLKYNGRKNKAVLQCKSFVLLA
jgi:hypothetical protein